MVIFLSSCISQRETGDLVYNGGVMGYNLWAKLLWKHGHEAYIVTYDGQYTPWMCDHQPVVSLEEAKRRGADRYATSWVEAKAFIDIAPQVYLADWEPFYSFYALNGATVDLLNANKIKDVCVETRYEQAYWRAVYDIDAHIVPPFCDRRYWRPAPARIISGRLGYFQENDAEGDAARRIGDYLSLETMRMSGTEQEVIDKLQTCDIYLCLNPGKDKYHCEGLARTVLEAMCCGCVVVAYDVGGNREFLIDGYNGFVGEHSVDAVAARVKWLMNSPEQKETLRSRSMDFALNAFTAERTWREMERFLEL